MASSEFQPVTRFAARRHSEALLGDLPGRVPSPASAIAGTVLLMLVAAAALLWSVPWVQTAAGTGRIMALDPGDRVQAINALVDGRINRWFVQDGSVVLAGAPIVEITDIDPNFIARIEAERAALARGLEAAQVAAETAKLDYERQKQLHGEGLTARKDFESAKIRYQETLAREASARAALNQTDIQLSRQSSQIVTAPRDGRIVHIEAGDTSTFVNAGDPIATFAPEHVERAVEVFVSGLDAPLVQPGFRGRVMFEGWPAVQLSGWPEAALGTFGAVVRSVDPVVSASGRFRVLLVADPDDQPWPDDRYLRLGGQAQAWIQLSTVRLGYELWRKLNRFPPRPVQADPLAPTTLP